MTSGAEKREESRQQDEDFAECLKEEVQMFESFVFL